jgi:hypothetical protein
VNVFYHLSNELVGLEWEADMHNVTLGDGCGLVDIYPKGLIPALHDLEQRLADLAEPNDYDSLIHSSV